MKSQNKISIIIADDHPLVRSGIRKELENIESFEVIGEADNGIDALKIINECNPNVAILDFEMPGLNGIEIVKILSENGSETKVILLTMHNEKQIFFKALDAGVKGYILKDDAILDIFDAVINVAEGKEYISKNLTSFLLDKIRETITNKNTLIAGLTTTEKNVLLLIAELATNDEIANKLFVSKRTVENYKVNIAKKINLKSARDLLKFSIENKEYLKEA